MQRNRFAVVYITKTPRAYNGVQQVRTPAHELFHLPEIRPRATRNLCPPRSAHLNAPGYARAAARCDERRDGGVTRK